MTKTMRSRKGVTLAEIMVVLALVAIMITMVVSFVMLITERTRANAQNDAMRRDVEIIRAGAERWLDAVASTTLTADGGKVTAGEGVSLVFQYGSLRGTLPGGESVSMRTESVSSVSFEVMANGEDTLLFCYITCQDIETDQTITFTVCLNSHVGEGGVLGGGNQ